MSRQKRLLIYGFEPYEQYRENVSQNVIRALSGIPSIKRQVLAVKFDHQMFNQVFEKYSPDIILGLGQHPRARMIRIERKARNVMKEANGAIETILKGSPPARFSNLSLPKSKNTTQTYNAGTYVCNFSMFLAGEYCAKTGAQFGFLHLPLTMSPDTITRYVSQCCKSLQGES